MRPPGLQLSFVLLVGTVSCGHRLLDARQFEITGSNGAGETLPALSRSSRIQQKADESTPFVLNAENVAAAASIAIAALLANSAGIGGGPLFLPILVNVLGFSVRTATFLSHTIVSSSAVGSTISGLWQTSPRNPDRSLTDLDLALLLIPSLLLGVSIGVIFNTIFPEWLQIVLLTCLLVPVILNTFKKAEKLRDSEQKESHRRASLSNPGPSPPRSPDHNILRGDTPLLQESDSAGSDDEVVLDEGSLLKATSLRRREASRAAAAAQLDAHPDAENPSLLQQLQGFRRRFQLRQFIVMILLWAIFLAFQVAKAYVEKCSKQYWLLFGSQVTLLLAATATIVWVQYRHLSHDASTLSPEIRILIQGNDANGRVDPVQAGWALLALTLLVFTSGVFAGCLGIGGAVLFGPLLISRGVHPQVVASTSVACILFSSSTIGISGYLLGLLNTSYAEVIGPLAFVASLLGVTMLGKYVKKSGRSSIIVYILASIITLGAVTTAVVGGLRSYQNIQQGKDIHFHPLCGRE